MKYFIVAALIGLLAFVGGAFAERNGHLAWLSGASASKTTTTDAETLRTVPYHAVLAAG